MKKKTLLQSSGFVTLFASLVCIAIGLLFGFLVLLLLGGDKAYSDGFKQILLGGFYMMPSGIGKEIVTAAPLIMCGLSVAFAFKTGLFNICAAAACAVVGVPARLDRVRRDLGRHSRHLQGLPERQ